VSGSISTRSINTTNWGITFGTKNTANCGDRVYFRITAGAGFTGYLDTISTVWNAV
jgi:hypothetical protein